MRRSTSGVLAQRNSDRPVSPNVLCLPLRFCLMQTPPIRTDLILLQETVVVLNRDRANKRILTVCYRPDNRLARQISTPPSQTENQADRLQPVLSNLIETLSRSKHSTQCGKSPYPAQIKPETTLCGLAGVINFTVSTKWKETTHANRQSPQFAPPIHGRKR